MNLINRRISRVWQTVIGLVLGLLISLNLALPSNLNVTPDTHSSLLLQYYWAQPLDRSLILLLMVDGN